MPAKPSYKIIFSLAMLALILLGSFSGFTLADAQAVKVIHPILDTSRPIIVVQSYSINVDTLQPGMDFTLKIRIGNAGQETASNVVIMFTPGEIVPRQTGGIIAVPEIPVGEKANLTQPLTASWDIWGKSFASLTMQANYQGLDGTTYTEQFVLTFPVYTPGVNFTATPTITPTPAPTATPTAGPVLRPQLVINSYKTDLQILQPGLQFTLEMEVQNVGNADAKRVVMIVGGGTASTGDVSGTPNPGGTSGGSGEFTNFAPIGSSNVQSMGDLPISALMTAHQVLIVNVTTNPGAYPMKISFVYVDEQGRAFVDDQVITLLVYSLPNVSVEFYQPPQPFFVGQPGMLPLQIINMGRKSAVLGNMRVTAEGAEFTNNVILIGNLDPGGYFPLDATIIPSAPGPLDLNITVEYTDDFNQQQRIDQVITIQVLESAPGPEGPGGPTAPGDSVSPGEPGNIPVQPPETFWQKLWRFILGLLGLDSGQSTSSGGEISVPANQPPIFDNGKPQKGP